MISSRTILAILCLASPLAAQVKPTAAGIGEAEAQKVEDRIATVRRDILSKYETALGDLQRQFEKAADLEAALSVRAERNRLHEEQALSERNYVNEPKSLRTLQSTTVTRMQELVSGVVNESLPKLVEYKKQLTMEGKLDDAVSVRQAIERLQNANVPISKTEAGSMVPVETLLQAYSADRGRADKTYKGVRFVVRGVMAGYRVDPNDATTLQIYVSSAGSTGWAQCSFSTGRWRYREERFGANTMLVLIPKEGNEIRVAKGGAIDVLGDCSGWDEMVKLHKCDIPR
jgi:hypothetical protein